MIMISEIKNRLNDLGIGGEAANYYIAQAISNGTIDNLLSVIKKQENINKAHEVMENG